VPIIENHIAACLNKHNPTRAKWGGEVIHRFTLNDGEDDVVRASDFLKAYPGLGGCMSYDLCIKKNGIIQQALPTNRHGWHAKGWSKTRLGIAVFGDFRTEQPTDAQWESLVWLLAQLSVMKNAIRFAAHDQLTNASNDPDKKCPGYNLNMNLLHDYVKLGIKEIGQSTLIKSGFTLEV